MPSHDKAVHPRAKGDVARYLENRQNEVDSAAQYRAMADSESRPGARQLFLGFAAAAITFSIGKAIGVAVAG